MNKINSIFCGILVTLVGFSVTASASFGSLFTPNLSNQEAQSEQANFDDVDVLHYQIVLDISDFKTKQIFGYTTIQFQTKIETDSVLFFLEGLTVDSVLYNGKYLNYNHLGKHLVVALVEKKVENELLDVTIYYHGIPKRDASWGGFYFSGDYAFNLGVGFTSNPHNYGRIWFPCVDNFTDRALYDFEITTSSDNRAMCNGLLQSSKDLGNGKTTWIWKLSNPIPTYLASVAIAPYTVNSFVYKGIPVTLSSIKSDSMKMVKSFEHLPNCIDAFQLRYGPHNFERVGFNAVPFNGGAMEHATNIAYPIYAVDSTFDWERLYAHEFAHHWWGNTVTCRTAEDMWINEGWASYSERLFFEYVYGKDRYKQEVSSNHFKVVHYAHLRDGDTLPIAGIGHTQTYGSHVYDKGADVVHTLRGYMGDSAFFAATSSFMVAYKFKDVSSEDLKNHFQKFTNRNLNAFFDNWVYNRGFPVFDILEWKVKKVGEAYENQVRIRQRSRFNPSPFTDLPLELTAISSDFKQSTSEVIIKGVDDWFTIKTSFKPEIWCIDLEEKISDAAADKAIMVKDTGSYDFGDALMKMHVSENKDSSFIRVEHLWVGADPWFNEGNQPFLSRERYWHVDGIWDKGFKASAIIEYNGRTAGGNYPDGYYDNDLIRTREDSLVLMYRATPSSSWEIDDKHTVVMRSPFDKLGTIEISELRKGEYALAMRDANLLSIDNVQTETSQYLKMYPNPTSDKINFEVKGAQSGYLEITSSNGVVIHRERIKSKNFKLSLDTTSWTSGIYYAGLVIDNQPYKPKLFFVY